MQFNFSRFISLTKRDFIVYKKPNILALIGIPILILLIFFVAELTEEHAFSHHFFMSWFTIFLWGGGLVLTSIIMWEFKTEAGRSQYLTIPASNLEKVLTRWTYSLILYPIFIIALFFIIGVAGNVYEGGLFAIWIFMKPIIKLFIVAHAFTFLCAVWFNNYALPKTFFLSLIVFFGIVIILSIFFRIIFHEAYDGLFMMSSDIRIEPDESFQKTIEQSVIPLLKSLFYWIVPVFFWVATYLKMNEKEA